MSNRLIWMNDAGQTIRYWLPGTVTAGALLRMPISEMENGSATNPKVSSERTSFSAVQI
jgi:hypothetical protein